MFHGSVLDFGSYFERFSFLFYFNSFPSILCFVWITSCVLLSVLTFVSPALSSVFCQSWVRFPHLCLFLRWLFVLLSRLLVFTPLWLSASVSDCLPLHCTCSPAPHHSVYLRLCIPVFCISLLIAFALFQCKFQACFNLLFRLFLVYFFLLKSLHRVPGSVCFWVQLLNYFLNPWQSVCCKPQRLWLMSCFNPIVPYVPNIVLLTLPIVTLSIHDLVFPEID